MGTHLKTKLLLLSAFLVIITSSSAFIYLGLTNYSYADFFRLLKLRALTTAKLNFSTGGSTEDQLNKELGDDYLNNFPTENDYFFEIIPGKDYSLEASNMGVPVSFFNEILTEGESEFRSRTVFYKGIKYTSGSNDYAVVVTAENYYDSHHLYYLRRILLMATLIAIIFAIGISLYLSNRIFNPLNEITHRTNEINSHSLHLRLAPKHKNDELGALAGTINNMLDRLETAFETQNNFISNASHELRTPLTAIIGEADVTLSKPRSCEEYVETIKIMLDEAEKLDKKTQALLFLAQTGFYEKEQKFSVVRMDQLIWDVQETLQKIHPECHIQLDLSALPENPLLLKVMGNQQLLHLALGNIVSNASKYSDNKTVKLSLAGSNGKVVIVVKDQGIGIPPLEMKHIYDPFFRASNTGRYEGYGIGLPLTRNIVRMHKGELLVSSIENKGTTVQISLPAAFPNG